MMSNKECQAGMFWMNNSMGCSPCPVGHYCPVGTSKHPEKCPVGTYNELEGLASPADCMLCPIGTYADYEGAFQCEQCPAGFFCEYQGQAHPIVCPINYYCPPHSIEPIMCPEGTSNDLVGQDEMIDCTAPEPVVCPAGQYLFEVTTCVDCPPGMYCSMVGGDVPTGECPEDHYCPPGTAEPTACP